MKITEKIQLAIIKAAELHSEQKTKLNAHPYVTHPYSVALVVSEYTDSEDVIAAALLHDVLEDVPGYSDVNMRNDFGQHVYNIVKELTEDKDPRDTDLKKIETWDTRKIKYLEKLKTDSQEALLVCCADKICNLSNMVRYYQEHGDSMFSQFNAPVEKQLWYYRETLKILKERLGGELVKELEDIFIQAEKLFSATQVSP